MKIYSIYDAEFKPYGQVLEGYDTKALCQAMMKIDLPQEGTAYEPGIDSLEACAVTADFRDRGFGGMPIQMGLCWGYNTKLNCLEYHRDSELNVGVKDFILLLAKREDLVNGELDTGKVVAFCCPAGTLVEVYATTLHYAPCNAAKDAGFKTIVVLPKGTNLDKPEITVKNAEDEILWASNKWLLAHAESSEAAQGAKVLLKGENIDIAALL